MVVMKKCCGFDLRYGVYCVGVASAFASCLSLANMNLPSLEEHLILSRSAVMIFSEEEMQHAKSGKGILSQRSTKHMLRQIGVLVELAAATELFHLCHFWAEVINLACSLPLIAAVRTENRFLLLPWMLSSLLVTYFSWPNPGFLFVVAALIYSQVCVISYYQMLRDNPRDRDPAGVVGTMQQPEVANSSGAFVFNNGNFLEQERQQQQQQQQRHRSRPTAAALDMGQGVFYAALVESFAAAIRSRREREEESERGPEELDRPPPYFLPPTAPTLPTAPPMLDDFAPNAVSQTSPEPPPKYEDVVRESDRQQQSVEQQQQQQQPVQQRQQQQNQQGTEQVEQQPQEHPKEEQEQQRLTGHGEETEDASKEQD